MVWRVACLGSCRLASNLTLQAIQDDGPDVANRTRLAKKVDESIRPITDEARFLARRPTEPPNRDLALWEEQS